jgi:addiction module RelB/DinJ family antitoxin
MRLLLDMARESDRAAPARPPRCDTTLVRQRRTSIGAAGDTTVTVRKDAPLKDEAARTLDTLGLSMSSAIRVCLTHVVAQKALPFPVQAAPPEFDTSPRFFAFSGIAPYTNQWVRGALWIFCVV